MSFEVIVTRVAGSSDSHGNIAISDWKGLVDDDPGLRLKAEPYVAVNPKTGEKITLAMGKADAEIHIDGEWLPFLRFLNGRLVTEYHDDFEDPSNAIRTKIAAVAKRLGGVITTDAGDGMLNW
jgi:hypothetical protein